MYFVTKQKRTIGILFLKCNIIIYNLHNMNQQKSDITFSKVNFLDKKEVR